MSATVNGKERYYIRCVVRNTGEWYSYLKIIAGLWPGRTDRLESLAASIAWPRIE